MITSPKKSSGSPGPVDPSGRFGIGTGFQLEIQRPLMSADECGVSCSPIVPNAQICCSTATTFTAALRCDICGVTANRLEQLETHKRGIRHQKMLRSNGMFPTEPGNYPKG